MRLASEVSSLGGAVVSGLALGIDAAAHRGCLDAPCGGQTIAVVACGLDQVYPREHGALFDEIKAQGLVLSEHPLGTPALPAYFPQRNRIIAGLGAVTVVVEATIRSGSLITARLALEAGRDVFAVPGHLSSPQSAGCNALIKGGAGLIESAEDLVAALPWAFPAAGGRPGEGGGRYAGRSGGRSRMRLQLRSQGRSRGIQLTDLHAASGPHPDPPTGRFAQTTDDDAVTIGRPSAGINAAFKPDPAMDGASWRRASALLRSRPCDLVELTAAADVPAHVVNRTLLLAELDGLVARLPGGLFQWCGPAR
jgi:DNA protecting protein DprA